jgi:urease accessory protein
MTPLLLLLLDSRAPAGAHAHSGGMEASVMGGHVHSVEDVEQFCRGRLATSGTVNAAFAATAHTYWSRVATASEWELLDAEYTARQPSEALRSASRSLGSGLQRMLRSMCPEADLSTPWKLIERPAPHHSLVHGAAVAIAGGDATLAAQSAALASITGPASAAVRLLGLDPLAVQAMLASLASDLGPFTRTNSNTELNRLASGSAPALDLLADVHRTSEVRLFAS